MGLSGGCSMEVVRGVTVNIFDTETPTTKSSVKWGLQKTVRVGCF